MQDSSAKKRDGNLNMKELNNALRDAERETEQRMEKKEGKRKEKVELRTWKLEDAKEEAREELEHFQKRAENKEIRRRMNTEKRDVKQEERRQRTLEWMSGPGFEGPHPQSLDEIKVSCYAIMSICRVDPRYCERSAYLQLPSLLIRLLTLYSDRSIVFEETIGFAVEALEEFVKCTTGRIRTEMGSQRVAVVGLAAHLMLRYHHNQVIATAAMRIIRVYKETTLRKRAQEQTFEKISEYLEKGEKKFGKLPLDDIRKKEFVELQKMFSPSLNQ